MNYQISATKFESIRNINWSPNVSGTVSDALSITHFLGIRPKGHQKPSNKVDFLKLVERTCGLNRELPIHNAAF